MGFSRIFAWNLVPNWTKLDWESVSFTDARMNGFTVTFIRQEFSLFSSRSPKRRTRSGTTRPWWPVLGVSVLSSRTLMDGGMKKHRCWISGTYQPDTKPSGICWQTLHKLPIYLLWGWTCSGGTLHRSCRLPNGSAIKVTVTGTKNPLKARVKSDFPTWRERDSALISHPSTVGLRARWFKSIIVWLLWKCPRIPAETPSSPHSGFVCSSSARIPQIHAGKLKPIQGRRDLFSKLTAHVAVFGQKRSWANSVSGSQPLQ